MRILFSPFVLLTLLVLLIVAPYLRKPDAFIALQNRFYTPPPELARFLRRFQRSPPILDPFVLPVLGESGPVDGPPNYVVQLAPEALKLRQRQVLLPNPFGEPSLPLSLSVLYRGHVVALFAPGFFACYQTATLARNPELERQLNTRRFTQHWLVDGWLVALADGQHFVFSEAGRWEPYRKPMPLGRKPILFEDERYLACATCQGEWGGEVYFYDKQRQQFYLTEATCVKSIYKQNGQYVTLSSLGHMMGSASRQRIDDPSHLQRWRGPDRPYDWQLEDGRKVTESHGQVDFDYYGLMMYADLPIQKRRVYAVTWNEHRFLATWRNDTISVVADLLYDAPVAPTPLPPLTGPDLTLTSLYDDDNAETACLLLAGSDLVQLNWLPETVETTPPLTYNILETSPSGEALTDSAEIIEVKVPAAR